MGVGALARNRHPPPPLRVYIIGMTHVGVEICVTKLIYMIQILRVIIKCDKQSTDVAELASVQIAVIIYGLFYKRFSLPTVLIGWDLTLLGQRP